ncbi:FeoA family protein [Defluviitalea phaphyphila]|uniref:FeoA family protein n=1 Tax=Defluviitalea phaphyphila TaxID=1473580 RepID=UPI00073097A1|nr:FeoA family protein [Defluviitalea phaphyphila]
MKNTYIPLNQVTIGKTCIVKNLKSSGIKRRRILDLGFIPNTKIKVIRRSPLGDPTAYLIRETMIALRKEEASKILVKVINN